MCGIIGLLLANEDEHVNQLLFDGLTVLQHRGQDAAGIVTAEHGRLHLRKDNGLVRDVFQPHHMMELRGNVGIGHCRYPTAGSSSCAEAQPLYTNYPYGLCVAHNGNLTNAEELTNHLRETARRHVNTDSDSELLLNVFAESFTNILDNQKNKKQTKEDEEKHDDNSGSIEDTIFEAMKGVMEQCRGGYAGVYLINGIGLVAFRDPHGIRPLVFGIRNSSGATDRFDSKGQPLTPSQLKGNGSNGQNKFDYLIASESVAMDTLGFELVRDVKPGEAIFIDAKTCYCHSRICHPNPSYTPCIFEYVYFARPDSVMDGISVYETRLEMGTRLAQNIIQKYTENHNIDVVIPIPDTSRTCALQAAYTLNRPFREGFIKNRYIARTFIMPGQATRKKSVRLKLNCIKSEFENKNVLLVDDSVVRGTTGREIVQMARDAGAKKVFFSSAAPPIRYPNVYGIDIPTREELIAYERNEEQIAEKLGADWIVYQELKELEQSVLCHQDDHERTLAEFDTSCFSGEYVTGEKLGDEYFTKLYDLRNDQAKQKRNSELDPQQHKQKSSGSPKQSNNGCESISNNKRPSIAGTSAPCESIQNNNQQVLQ